MHFSWFGSGHVSNPASEPRSGKGHFETIARRGRKTPCVVVSLSSDPVPATLSHHHSPRIRQFPRHRSWARRTKVSMNLETQSGVSWFLDLSRCRKCWHRIGFVSTIVSDAPLNSDRFFSFVLSSLSSSLVDDIVRKNSSPGNILGYGYCGVQNSTSHVLSSGWMMVVTNTRLRRNL